MRFLMKITAIASFLSLSSADPIDIYENDKSVQRDLMEYMKKSKHSSKTSTHKLKHPEEDCYEYHESTEAEVAMYLSMSMSYSMSMPHILHTPPKVKDNKHKESTGKHCTYGKSSKSKMTKVSKGKGYGKGEIEMTKMPKGKGDGMGETKMSKMPKGKGTGKGYSMPEGEGTGEGYTKMPKGKGAGEGYAKMPKGKGAGEGYAKISKMTKGKGASDYSMPGDYSYSMIIDSKGKGYVKMSKVKMPKLSYGKGYVSMSMNYDDYSHDDYSHDDQMNHDHDHKDHRHKDY